MAQESSGQEAGVAESNSKNGRSRAVRKARNPLAPLNRDEIDWESVYEIYRDLTPCERRVLDMLVGREDPKRIAKQLGVATTTVRNQTASLKQKFGASSLPELIGLITSALYEEARRLSAGPDLT